MTRLNALAAAALALGVFACDRNEKTSETNTWWLLSNAWKLLRCFGWAPPRRVS